MTALISAAHFIGLALGVGAATVKLALLIKCSRDRSFLPVYFGMTKLLTRTIISGIVLLIVSGIAWLFNGYPFTPLLILKLALVAAILVLGPLIDNVFEPKFRSLAPAGGDAFAQAQRQFLAVECVATLLFYVIVVLWVARGA